MKKVVPLWLVTLWLVTLWLLPCSGCTHVNTKMIYSAYFPPKATLNREIDWYVVTSMRPDSVEWTMYLTHAPMSGRMEEYYMGGLKPVPLWVMDMLPVKGIDSSQDLQRRYNIPRLEISGYYKINLRVWNNWFEDRKEFNMQAGSGVEFEVWQPPIRIRP